MSDYPPRDLPPFVPQNISPAAVNMNLRDSAEEICAQLCAAASGNLDFHVSINSDDETAQKLSMLANFVLDTARRALSSLKAKALDLHDAYRIARIGTWRHDIVSDTLTFSSELHNLLGTDPENFEATLEDFLGLLHPDDHHTIKNPFTYTTAAVQKWRVMHPAGSVSWFWSETCLEVDTAGEAIALRGICQDVTERRETTDQIFRLAHYDPLTDLANRSLFQDRLFEAVARAQRTSSILAVLYLDLDGFKAVNDLHGHGAGDVLLCEVAARLCSSVRKTDIVARFGGDEFVVLQDGPITREAAHALAARLVSTLADPYELNNGIVMQSAVTTSIGVAIYPDDGKDSATLLRNADTALYCAKLAGKNRSSFFHAEMDSELRERRTLEYDIRQAVVQEGFALAWQPLSSEACNGRITGFEVLLRWYHPVRGEVSPDIFIPVLELTGAISTIGAWVLDQACKEAAHWAKPLQVSVNVSPLQAQQGMAFAEMVESALVNSGLTPSRLELEVTESILINKPQQVLIALHKLKALGVQVVLDDFGTGYSSLSTLRTFPFDKLKIDRSFVAGLAVNEQDRAIVRAVLGLARGLGLPVVAEGVETELQLHMLRTEGCEQMQGWLIGRPASISTFAHLTNPIHRVLEDVVG